VKSRITTSVQRAATSVTWGSSSPASVAWKRFTATRQMPMTAAVARM
jgi:hypothetical protein